MARQTYTTEQLAALEEMKQEGLELGAARAEFVNKILQADGTVSDDIANIAREAGQRVADILSGDTSDPVVLQSATEAARKAKEIDAMIAEDRFLFIAGDDGLPIIYFQCATPGNPDVR